jgi:ureidoacrylate peracid hydrolase
MKLDPAKAALIVVDMQTSFCHPEGRVASIGFDISKCTAAIEPCREVLDMARQADMPVIFTRYVYQADYSDGGVMVKCLLPELAEHEALQAGSADIEVVPELEVKSGDIVIDKNRPSSFYKTDLDNILEKLGVSQLVVCGVTTNCCVESTVRDASHRDFEVFVVGDACGELDEERHHVALKSMDMLFADVINRTDLKAATDS